MNTFLETPCISSSVKVIPNSALSDCTNMKYDHILSNQQSEYEYKIRPILDLGKMKQIFVIIPIFHNRQNFTQSVIPKIDTFPVCIIWSCICWRHYWCLRYFIISYLKINVGLSPYWNSLKNPTIAFVNMLTYNNSQVRKEYYNFIGFIYIFS